MPKPGSFASLVLLATLAGGCGTDRGPAVPVTLPAPTGPHAVGVTPLGEFYTTAYYPAQAGTGQGRRRYASLPLLHTLGVDALDVTAHAEVGALPLTDAPHPVVVFTPGGSSYAELSTALAEQLASSGYVVILVQPDAELEDSGTGLAGSQPAAALIDALRIARQRQVTHVLDLLDEPGTAALVGPIDPQRIAAGGHSYGGSTAFNASLTDPRIRAVFDLDGSLFEDATTTPTTVPSLVVMAFMYQLAQHPHDFGSSPDVELGLASLAQLKTNPHVVAVGLAHAEHYDVTDAAAIAPALPAELASTLGAIGPVATPTTSTIVERFLDAALAPTPRQPTADELIRDLPAASLVVFP